MGWFRRKDREEFVDVDEDVLVVVERAIDPYLVLFGDPRGAEAEQYRGLRNHIVAMNPEHSPRTVLLTSALPGEGKSTTTLNLGMALAEQGDTRVLVVDADLRKPRIEALLGINRRKGLSEVLRSRYTLDRAIHRTPYKNLYVIGAGALPANPSELLASDRMRMVLNALKEDFNYILIDSPPVLDVTDTPTLGRIADGVLLVVRLESTPRQDVDRSLGVLENLGSNVLGTFVVGTRKLARKRKYSYQGDADGR